MLADQLLGWEKNNEITLSKNNKQHEIYMPNANQTLAYPTQTIFYLLTLGVALSAPGFTLGAWGFTLGPRRLLDTNMLVSATQKSRIGSITQRKAATQGVLHSGRI